MGLNLFIDAPLSAPPSSPTSFRDLTLQAKILEYDNVVAIAPNDTQSFYWEWMKGYGAKDYLDGLYELREVKKERGIFLIEQEEFPVGRFSCFSNGVRMKALRSECVIFLRDYLRWTIQDNPWR